VNQLDSAALRDRPHSIQIVGQQAVDVVGGELELLLAELDARERQQIGSESRKAFSVLADDIQKLEIVDRIVDRAVRAFRCSPESSQRSALVRNVDDEILADALEFFELGMLGFRRSSMNSSFSLVSLSLWREAARRGRASARKSPSPA
jgi:hypothetical protein